MALPDGLVQDTLVLTVKGNIDGVGLQTANGTIQLSVEGIVYIQCMNVHEFCVLVSIHGDVYPTNNHLSCVFMPHIMVSLLSKVYSAFCLHA